MWITKTTSPDFLHFFFFLHKYKFECGCQSFRYSTRNTFSIWALFNWSINSIYPSIFTEALMVSISVVWYVLHYILLLYHKLTWHSFIKAVRDSNWRAMAWSWLAAGLACLSTMETSELGTCSSSTGTWRRWSFIGKQFYVYS